LRAQDLPFKALICPTSFLLDHPVTKHADYPKWARHQISYTAMQLTDLALNSKTMTDLTSLELSSPYSIARQVPPILDPHCKHPVFMALQKIQKVSLVPNSGILRDSCCSKCLVMRDCSGRLPVLLSESLTLLFSASAVTPFGGTDQQAQE
jgi:hypothetical protein